MVWRLRRGAYTLREESAADERAQSARVDVRRMNFILEIARVFKTWFANMILTVWKAKR